MWNFKVKGGGESAQGRKQQPHANIVSFFGGLLPPRGVRGGGASLGLCYLIECARPAPWLTSSLAVPFRPPRCWRSQEAMTGTVRRLTKVGT